jgi:hypothetical protein
MSSVLDRGFFYHGLTGYDRNKLMMTSTLIVDALDPKEKSVPNESFFVVVTLDSTLVPG